MLVSSKSGINKVKYLNRISSVVLLSHYVTLGGSGSHVTYKESRSFFVLSPVGSLLFGMAILTYPLVFYTIFTETL